MSEISFGWLVLIGIGGAVLGKIIFRFFQLRKQNKERNN